MTSADGSILDRGVAPTPGPTREFAFPEIMSLEVPGTAFRLLSVPRMGGGLVALRALAPGGGLHTGSEPPALASLTSSMLDEGAGGRSSTEIALAFERLGGSIGSGCDWDASGVSTEILARHLDDVLEVFVDVLAAPDFPEEDLDRLRQQRLAEIERREKDPGALAAIAFAQALYEGTPYGEPLLGRRSTLADLRRSDLVRFHASTVGREGTVFIATGEHQPQALAERLGKLLTTLTSGSAPALPTIEGTPRDSIRIGIVDREGEQTELRIGHIGPAFSCPGREARTLLNSILGGKFTSRINLNLRERHGFTYGASSRFADRLGPGPFVVSAAVATDSAGRATEETVRELVRIREEPVTNEELEDAKSWLLGVFPYTLQTFQGIAGRLEALAIHNLPLDHFRTLPGRLAAVTREDVQTAAQDHLFPDRLDVIAVGPFEQLQPQLAALGEVRRVELAL